MGLKFQREDTLDRKFAEFAMLPDEKADKLKEKEAAIQRFLKPETKDEEKITTKKDASK